MVKLSPLARGIGLWSGYVVEVSDDDNDDNDSNGDFAGQWASDNKVFISSDLNDIYLTKLNHSIFHLNNQTILFTKSEANL